MDINDSDYDELRELDAMGDRRWLYCRDCGEDVVEDDNDPDACPRCRADWHACDRCDEHYYGDPIEIGEDYCCERCADEKAERDTERSLMGWGRI